MTKDLEVKIRKTKELWAIFLPIFSARCTASARAIMEQILGEAQGQMSHKEAVNFLGWTLFVGAETLIPDISDGEDAAAEKDPRMRSLSGVAVIYQDVVPTGDARLMGGA